MDRLRLTSSLAPITGSHPKRTGNVAGRALTGNKTAIPGFIIVNSNKPKDIAIAVREIRVVLAPNLLSVWKDKIPEKNKSPNPKPCNTR